MFKLDTGEALDGAGGNIEMFVGPGKKDIGGHVLVGAGYGPDEGGSVRLIGGSGESNDRKDAGHGGSVDLIGGTAYGQRYYGTERQIHHDHGGPVTLLGGTSEYSVGGYIHIVSGKSLAATKFGHKSGEIRIETNNSTKHGRSGGISLSTGTSIDGNSGDIRILTGTAKYGAGGNFVMHSGEGSRGTGGNITLLAGTSTDHDSTGGSIDVIGGAGTNQMSYSGGNGGSALVKGGDSYGGRRENTGGDVNIQGGGAQAGVGGSLLLNSGKGRSSGFIGKDF